MCTLINEIKKELQMGRANGAGMYRGEGYVIQRKEGLKSVRRMGQSPR